MASSVPMRDFVDRLRSISGEISERCAGSETGARAAHLLDRLSRRLARPPRIAILGEVNSGKTSLSNALLGTELLSTDVIHNTRAPVLVRHAEEPHVRLRRNGEAGPGMDLGTAHPARLSPDTFIEVGVPIDILRDFEIIDTPGTTSADEQMHRSVAIARQANVVVWCTLGTQAWKASEAACCRAIGRRPMAEGVLAVTHADLLDVSDQAKVRRRLEAAVSGQFRAIALAAMSPQPAPSTDAGPDAPAGLIEILAGVRAAVAAIQRQRQSEAMRVVDRFVSRLADSGDEARVVSGLGDTMPAAAATSEPEPRPLLVAAE